MNGSLASKASKEKTAEQGYGRVDTHAQESTSTGVHGDILDLQRSVGNRAVNQVLKSGVANPGAIQGKLTISQPGDKYEQEADRVADQVMRMPEGEVGTKTPSVTPVQTQSVQRDAASGQVSVVTPSVQAKIEGLQRSGGEPLSEDVRGFMEPGLGQDLSRVRVHHSTVAGDLADQLSARAFTVGNNILFGRGEYHGGPPNKNHLLAHELTHVAQHGVGAPLAVRRVPKPVSGPTGADLYQIVEGIGGLELEGRKGKRSFETWVSKLSIGQKKVLFEALVEEKSRLQYSASSGFGGKLSFKDRKRTTQINIALRILNASATNLAAELPTDPKASTGPIFVDRAPKETQKNPRDKAPTGSRRRRRKKTEPKERPETKIALVPTEEDRITVEGQVDQLLQMDPEAAERVIGRISNIGHLVSLTKEVSSRPPTDRSDTVRATLERRRADEFSRREAIEKIRQEKTDRQELERVHQQEEARIQELEIEIQERELEQYHGLGRSQGKLPGSFFIVPIAEKVPGVRAAAQGIQSADAFFKGFVSSVSTQKLNEEQRKRLLRNGVFSSTPPGQAALYAGITEGITEDVIDTLKGLPDLPEAIAMLFELVDLILSPGGERVARQLGLELGRGVSDEIKAMSKMGPLDFAYELGKRVGPIVAGIVLSIATTGGGAGARLAKVLGSLGEKGRRLLARLRRLGRKGDGGHIDRPDVDLGENTGSDLTGSGHVSAETVTLAPDVKRRRGARKKTPDETKQDRPKRTHRQRSTSEEIEEMRQQEISEREGQIRRPDEGSDTPLKLTEGQFRARFKKTYLPNIKEVEKHHSFFRYLLRAINKSRGKRGIPRHGRLIPLKKAQHEALHELFDATYPKLARGEGVSDKIAKLIQNGDTTPSKIANTLLRFYQDVSKKSPGFVPRDMLGDIEKIITSIRKRGDI